MQENPVYKQQKYKIGNKLTKTNRTRKPEEEGKEK